MKNHGSWNNLVESYQNKLHKLLLDILYIQIRKVNVDKNNLHIWCESKLESCHYRNCLDPRLEVTRYEERKVRVLSISNRKAYSYLTNRQFRCTDSNCYFQNASV